MAHFHSEIDGIVNDCKHGSSILLKNIMEVLDNPKLTKEELEWAFSMLDTIDPSMVIIHHFINELRPKIGRSFIRHLHSYERKWKNVENRIADRLARHLNHHKLWILVHSNSGTIVNVLKHLSSKGFDVRLIQTESQPGGEGSIQAEDIKELGLHVHTIPDADVWIHLMDMDAVLLGMDQFSRSFFVNKVGSKRIVEIANRFDVPVFVLGDSRKKVMDVEVQSNSFFEIVPIRPHVKLITQQPESSDFETYTYYSLRNHIQRML